MIDVWVGDDWTIGSELGIFWPCFANTTSEQFPYLRPNDDIASKSYAGLVSKARGTKYYNLSKANGGIHLNLYSLSTFDPGEEQVTVFLSNTYETRRFALDIMGEPRICAGAEHAIPVDNPMENDAMLHDRNMYAIYDYTIALNHIYLLCLRRGWDLKIINTWYVPRLHDDVLIVPDDRFLNKDRAIFLWGDSIVTKYFRPCADRPNLKGHELIAKHILHLLGNL